MGNPVFLKFIYKFQGFFNNFPHIEILEHPQLSRRGGPGRRTGCTAPRGYPAHRGGGARAQPAQECQHGAARHGRPIHGDTRPRPAAREHRTRICCQGREGGGR